MDGAKGENVDFMCFFSNCSRLMFSFNYSTKQHMNYKTNKQRQAKTKKKTRVDFLILGVLQPLLK